MAARILSFPGDQSGGKGARLENRARFINETQCDHLEYIEETQGGNALLPEEPTLRARPFVCGPDQGKFELYIELRHAAATMEVFFGGKVDQAIRKEGQPEMLARCGPLKRHGKVRPLRLLGAK